MEGLNKKVFLSLLQKHGFTQHEVASRLNVSDITVSRWLANGVNHRNPTISTLCELCNVLNTTPNVLLGFSDLQ